MSTFQSLAEVHLYGRRVGVVGELSDGRIVFEFDASYASSGLDLSPMHLPRRAAPFEFPELRRSEAFQGLPGLLADALPDAFGKRVIRAWYTARGERRLALSPVQNLLYVGSRAIGALEFEPAADLNLRARDVQALELADLVDGARAVVSGELDSTLPEIYRLGSSAGGARPKAIVLWNPESHEIRSPFREAVDGDVHAILKFDGVGDNATRADFGSPQPFNRVEAAYSRMAVAAGLDAVEITPYFTADGFCHLFVPRFDRVVPSAPSSIAYNGKIHQHTLGGLLHSDYNVPGQISYEEFFRTLLELGMGMGSVLEAYRRAIFNILAVNQDDHVKNISLQLHPSGEWKLAPAYDLTFARGSGFTREHQMRFRDKTTGFSRADLVAVGEDFRIRNPDRVVHDVHAALARLPEFALETRVDAETLRFIVLEINDRLASLDLRPIDLP